MNRCCKREVCFNLISGIALRGARQEDSSLTEPGSGRRERKRQGLGPPGRAPEENFDSWWEKAGGREAGEGESWEGVLGQQGDPTVSPRASTICLGLLSTPSIPPMNGRLRVGHAFNCWVQMGFLLRHWPTPLPVVKAQSLSKELVGGG